ncbi:hypothetical protein [Methanobrevibacter sp.]|uniref:hypothetical protein n=1 Tax=Methanobrevibacter sp. TaxID=66852 RepID=UPI0038658EF5
MNTKRLISSYDEINDTFVGKIDGKNSYCADYSISDGIFLAIDKNNIPCSVFVDNASNVFNVPKTILENSNVKIAIDCDSVFLSFNMFIEDLKICSIKSENRCGIPKINFLMDTNY